LPTEADKLLFDDQIGTQCRFRSTIASNIGLFPDFLYYPWKSYKEARYREPELRILHDIVPRGRVAIDVGANRGYYAFALSKIARRVEAFEPYPPAALFARSKLGRNVRVHEVAVSNYSGSATLHIPQRKGNIDVHFSATLKEVPAGHHREITVQVVTIDQFEFDDVGFIKIDAEGSDMEVIDGARETIRRNRPNMLVELLPFNRDALACIERIEAMFGYAGRIIVAGKLLDARLALDQYPASIRTFNVVFTPFP
jgi:FkbM family methyltransferase